MHMKKNTIRTDNPTEQGSRVKRGTISVIYTVVFIALVVALNLVVSSIAGSINLTIDLTAEEFISIGEVSRNVLGGLEEDGDLEATIYLLADRDAYDATSYDSYGNATNITRGLNMTALVRDLCEEYAFTYSGIRVEYKNLTRDPEWAATYNERTNTTLAQNNIVVEGKYHARVLTIDSFYTIDTDTRTYVGFNGELRLTTALLQSCMSEPQVVTFTTGHGEPAQLNANGSAMTALSYLLRNNGFEIQTADLTTGDIDPRTRILIVDDPQTDFTESEIEKLMDYVGDYNSLIVLVDDATPKLPNLSDYLLEEWGMGYKPYHQITSSENFNNDPLNLSAKYVTDMEKPDSSAAYQVIKNLASAGIKSVMPHSVELYSAPVGTKDKYTVETVLQSASGSLSTYKPDDAERVSTEGQFPLMMLSTNADYVDLDDENSTNQVLKYQYVMLIGSTAFAETGSLDSASYGNGSILLSTVRTMGVERYSLDISYTPMNDVALSIETSAAFRLAIIICAVLPAAISIAGLVVFVRRRHL